MAFKQPHFWKKLERHPLGAKIEDVDEEIYKGIVEGIKEFGIIDRKVILHEDKVLDGWTMLRACIELNVKPDFGPLPKGIDAESYVNIKNNLRRQSPIEDTLARIKERRERVAVARSSGKSLRAIAEEEKVDPKTVQNDLKSAGVEGSTPAKTPEKVTGRDGKNYEPTKPAVKCERCIRTGRNDPNCVDCAALRQSKKPKPGSARFDEKKFDPAYGALVRVVDQRANALGKGKGFKRCMDLLNDFVEAYSAWKKETA